MPDIGTTLSEILPPSAAMWQWVASSDSGTSSAAIWSQMTGQPAGRYGLRDDVPWDAGDLGRCIRLLDLFPQWRPRLPEMVEVSPAWGPIVEAWDELVRVYRQEPVRLNAALDALNEGRCCCRRYLLSGSSPASERHGRHSCSFGASDA